jgi:hypothetical protein
MLRVTVALAVGNADSNYSRLAPVSVPLSFRRRLQKIEGLIQNYKMTSLNSEFYCSIGQSNTMPKIADF